MIKGHKSKSLFYCLFCNNRFENIIEISIERKNKFLNSFICVECFNKYFRYYNFSDKRIYTVKDKNLTRNESKDTEFVYPPLERLEGIKDEGAMRELDDDLTRKQSRPYLCQICKLTDTCQNNFDYECVEASDFLFTPKDIIFTIKDAFLDSLIQKNHNALRG